MATTSISKGSADDLSLKNGILWSLLLHIALFLGILIKSIILPDSPPYIPTLRVDVVDLPDVLKKDLEKVHKNTSKEKPAEVQEKETVESKVTKKADPDEMAAPLKAKSRKKDIQNALARIRALEKLEQIQKAEARDQSIVKGNILSPGTTVGSDARESAEPNYYDKVLEHLRAHWALPVWLARQDYSAQVRIHLDARGQLVQMVFEKASGNEQFDEIVKNTITEGLPFPPPPPDFVSNVRVNGILLGFPL